MLGPRDAWTRFWMLSLLAAPALGAPLLAACSSSSSGASGADASVDAGGDSPMVPIDAGVPFVPGLPSPFFQACSSAGAADCPDAMICFTGHTSPIDVYDECTVECVGDNAALCTVSGGSCVCPSTTAGQPGDCSAGNDAGLLTVCAPLDDAAGIPAPGDAGAADE
jgi:hypothetical protein